MVSRHVLAPVKPPAKKLTQQEFQESMQRLYDRPVQQAKKRRDQYDADVSAQTQKMHRGPEGLGELSDRESKMIHSLYTNSCKKKEMGLENLRQKYEYPLPKTKVQSGAQQEETLDRLYGQSVERKRLMLRDAERRMYGVPAAQKTLSGEEVKSSLSRLCGDSMQRRQEVIRKVEEEYSFQPPTGKRMTADELKAATIRLSTRTD
jgi:hypothetical protein|uniref:Uncharacterized protein n=1 Tax=Eutreptiella gymnastica TaxID=73025 RepID=A0A7S4LE89_9EUGL